jgi:hypothetical protein
MQALLPFAIRSPQSIDAWSLTFKESFMGLPLSQTRFDANAYLAWDAAQPEKSEYVAGESACHFESVTLTPAVATAFKDVDSAEA